MPRRGWGRLAHPRSLGRSWGGGGCSPATRDSAPAEAGQGTWLTGPIPTLLAAHLVLACFRHLTGLDDLPQPGGGTVQPALTRVDLSTLDTTSHLLGPVLPNTIDEPVPRGTRIEPTELLKHAESFVDPHVGLLRQLDEENLPQLPLWVCRARVSDACLVTGCGEDRNEARVRALLGACAAYGSLTGDRGGTIAGTDLATGEVRSVPATDVFPERLTGVPVGAAAGLTWTTRCELGYASSARHSFPATSDRFPASNCPKWSVRDEPQGWCVCSN